MNIYHFFLRMAMCLLLLLSYLLQLNATNEPYNHDLAIEALTIQTLDSDSAIRHWTTIYEGLELDENLKYKGDVALILSKAYNRSNKCDSIIFWKDKAFEIYKSIGDTRGMAEVMYQEGYIGLCQTEYNLAIQDVLIGLEIMEELDDVYGIALGHLRLSKIFHNAYNLGESAEYGVIAGEEFDKLGVHIYAWDAWYLAGNGFRVNLDSTQALFAFNKAMDAAEKSGLEPLIGKALRGLGFYYMEFNDFEKSEDYFLEAMNFLNPKDRRDIMINQIGLAQVYLKEERYEECISISQLALKEVYRRNDIFFLSEVPEYLAKSYEGLGKYDSAYHYMNINWQYSDSLFFKEQDASLKDLSLKYESEKKDAQIEKQARERIYGLGLIGLLGLLALSVLKFNQRKLKFASILQEKNKEREELKTKLYTNITHEFRTPLTVIMGINNELFNSTKNLRLPTNQKEIFLKNQQLIQRNSQNLLNLVNQLLDLSKSDGNQLSLKLVQADIIPYLNYLTESFYSRAEEKKVRLLFYTEQESLIMDYDEQKMQHIAYNLLSNAIKFTPENGKIVMHASLTSRDDKSVLQLIVKDDGIGIAEDQLAFIFDRFYQVDDSNTRQVDGTGIGLSLTKDMVELMHGEITVESRVGEGTTFIINIPITNQAQKSDFVLPVSPIQSFEEDSLMYAQTVEDNLFDDRPILLIVEDNRDVFSYLKLVLSQTYQIMGAANGEQGILKAKETIPDLIISDVMMPIKDGYELTETLKRDTSTSHIPIILLTAKSTHDDKVEGLSIGADAYLTKPFDKQELLIRINKLIESRLVLQQYYSLVKQATPRDLSSNEASAHITQEKDFMNQIKAIIDAHLTMEKLNADLIASKIGMSRAQIYRKIKALTGLSINQYIRDFRLQKSLELLKTTDKDIAEIAYEVGFSSPSYFSKSFHKVYRQSPLTYRKILSPKILPI